MVKIPDWKVSPKDVPEIRSAAPFLLANGTVLRRCFGPVCFRVAFLTNGLLGSQGGLTLTKIRIIEEPHGKINLDETHNIYLGVLAPPFRDRRVPPTNNNTGPKLRTATQGLV